MRRPTSVEPVKAILSTPACSTRAAPVAPSPVTTLSTPGGKPALWASSANSKRRERRELRRLQDHGVSGSQRRRHLPGQHQQREVPRNDLAYHADGVVGGQFAVLQLRPARMMIEMSRRQRHIEVARLADRLAVVEAFQNGKKPRMTLQHAGQRIEMARPSMAPKLLPMAACALRAAATAASTSSLEPSAILRQKLARGRFVRVDLFGAGHKGTANEMAKARLMRRPARRAPPHPIQAPGHSPWFRNIQQRSRFYPTGWRLKAE